VCDSITTQFVGNDLPRRAAIVSYKASEETFCRGSITLCLQVDINHLAILVNSTPQVMLLNVDLNENCIDLERVAKASVFSL